jgi:RNA polymerase primary sigma factor
MENFESINFNRKTINRVVIKFRNLVNRFNELRRRIKDGQERTFSKDLKGWPRALKVIEGNEKELMKMTKDTGLSYHKFRFYVTNALDAQRRLDRLFKETEMNLQWISDTYTAIWKGERAADLAKSEVSRGQLTT